MSKKDKDQDDEVPTEVQSGIKRKTANQHVAKKRGRLQGFEIVNSSVIFIILSNFYSPYFKFLLCMFVDDDANPSDSGSRSSSEEHFGSKKFASKALNVYFFSLVLFIFVYVCR